VDVDYFEDLATKLRNFDPKQDVEKLARWAD
jgi:hypothetical protein